MRVEALRHRMEERRVNLAATPPSPARDEAVRNVTADLATLSRARGEDTEQVLHHAQQADRLRIGGQLAGASLGLGLGAALATSVADPVTAGVVGVAMGTAGALVLWHLGRDGAGALADRFVQANGADEVVRRWTGPQDPLPSAPSGKQNALTDLMGQVRSQVESLPDGPDKRDALAFLDRDLAVAGRATGQTMDELCSQTEKRERLVKLGAWTGVGVGVVLSGCLVLRATQGLVDPLTAIRGTIMGSGIALAGGLMAGRWVGGKLGDRHQVAGMKDVLERWKPVHDERERSRVESEEAARRVFEGGEKAAIRVEPGGLRVGGVLLRVPRKSRD